MQQFIILLRGVNVSGKNIIKMQELKNWLMQNGMEAVQTYIQSGNIVLKSHLKPSALKLKIKELILAKFELDIEVFVQTLNSLKNALALCPYVEGNEPNKVFITFLDRVPAQELVEKLQAVDHKTEVFSVHQDLLFFYLPDGMAKSKMNNNYFENKLKVNASGRNVNTIQKLIEMASA